jgi:hypothetical protein
VDARRRDEYSVRLEDANELHCGNSDGRGSLSEEELRHWCAFLLDVWDDQVSSMFWMPDLDEMKSNQPAVIAP